MEKIFAWSENMKPQNQPYGPIRNPLGPPLTKCDRRDISPSNHQCPSPSQELPDLPNRPSINRRPGRNDFWDPVNSRRTFQENEFETGNRVTIFIDNSSVFLGSRENHIRLDHRRLVEFLSNEAIGDLELETANLYCTIDPTAHPEKLSQTKGVYQMFSTFPRFVVNVIELRTMQRNGEWPYIKIEKGLDVALTADLLFMASRNLFDIAILCISDEAYIPAVVSAQKMGRQIYIATFDHDTATQFATIADGVISLTHNAKQIERIIESPWVGSSLNRERSFNKSHSFSCRSTSQHLASRSASNAGGEV